MTGGGLEDGVAEGIICGSKMHLLCSFRNICSYYSKQDPMAGLLQSLISEKHKS